MTIIWELLALYNKASIGRSTTQNENYRSNQNVATHLERNCYMSTSESVLHIDIPVKLAEAKVAFSIASLSFEGDLPASLFHLRLIQNDISDWNANAEIYAVFHTNAGHVTLNDESYNTDRNITTGNPYKKLVADLVQFGVHVELCGATARVHNWGNSDLLPGIKINTDAMARITQLIQEGFAQISES